MFEFSGVAIRIELSLTNGVPSVAGDVSRDLYRIVGISHRIFWTKYDSPKLGPVRTPNSSRDVEKLNF